MNIEDLYTVEEKLVQVGKLIDSFVQGFIGPQIVHSNY